MARSAGPRSGTSCSGFMRAFMGKRIRQSGSARGRLLFDGEVEAAIARYMDVGGVSFEKEIDLRNAPRAGGASQKILFEKAEIQRGNNVYSSEESLDLVYTLDAADDFDGVRFMMILFYQDGMRIGKAESEGFAVRRGRNEVPVSLPLECLADGQYYFEISVLLRNRTFAREKCDCIRNMIPITICNTEVFGAKGEHWRSDYWGHVMLKPIRVTDCR